MITPEEAMAELAGIYLGPPDPPGKSRYHHMLYDLVRLEDGTAFQVEMESNFRCQRKSLPCAMTLSGSPSDILLLKYSNANRGADLAVAKALGKGVLSVNKGEHQFFQSNDKIKAVELLVLGVGSLQSFEYVEIERFGKTALEIISRERPEARVIALTIHGPGYGLDELAAIDSLVRGLDAGGQAFGSRNVQVIIVEKSDSRAQRVQNFLTGRQGGTDKATRVYAPAIAASISRGHTYSKRLFATMPFKTSFLDHWELALQPAAHEANLLIERLDHEHFTGDIVAEIKNRISKCVAVVALLDEGNPNVFLEIGYAWGLGKPTILALNLASEPPFDVRGHKILRYARIGELKSIVSTELAGLAGQGIF
jgi:hypothetical protein